MSRLRLAILGIGLALGTASCSGTSSTDAVPEKRTIDVSALAPPYRLEIHEPGQPAVGRLLVAGSPEETSMRSWLQRHESGWEASSVNYPPGKLVRGDRFELNFIHGRVVLRRQEGPTSEWVQWTRVIIEVQVPRVFDQGHYVELPKP